MRPGVGGSLLVCGLTVAGAYPGGWLMALVTMLAAPAAVRALLITILNGQLLTLLGSRCSAASEPPLAQPTRARTAARPYPV